MTWKRYDQQTHSHVHKLPCAWRSGANSIRFRLDSSPIDRLYLYGDDGDKTHLAAAVAGMLRHLYNIVRNALKIESPDLHQPSASSDVLLHPAR
jgi:hypothetical protein